MRQIEEGSEEASWWRRFVEVGWIALVLTVVSFGVAFWVLPFRGTNLWGLWLDQGSGAVSMWLSGDGSVDGFWGAGTLDRAWAGQSALPPATVFLVALGRSLGLGPLGAAHAVAALCTALTVPLVWGLARRSGGPPAASAAAFALLFTPRILGHATEAGFSAPAMFGLTLAVYALYRARVSALWTAVAVVAVPLGTLFGHLTPLVLIPWVLLTLTDRGQVSTLLVGGTDPTAADGYLRPRSFPVRLVWILALAVPLTVALYPWTWAAPTEHLWAYLSHFLVRPKPVFLYFGDLLTSARLPWHGGAVLLFATTPPVIAALGVFGLLGEIVLRPVFQTSPGARLKAWIAMRADGEAAGPEAWEAKRWAFAFLVLTLLLPWFAGAPWFGVVDLVSLSVPFFAVFVGCSVSRLFSMTAAVTRALPLEGTVGRLRGVALWVGLTALGAMLFLPALLETVRTQPVAESYYSWFIGGTDGAIAKGLPRYAGGPVPLSVARHLADLDAQLGGGQRVAILADAGQWGPVLSLYQRAGLVAGLPRVGSAAEARIVVLPHADMEASYYHGAADFARRVPPSRSAVLRSGAVRLVTVGQPLPP